MLTTGLLGLVLGSVVMTSFLSGIFGMAGGMVLMGILGLLMPVSSAMTIHGISQLAANGSRCVTLYRHIDWRSSGLYFLGAIVSFACFWSVQFIPHRPVLLFLLGLLPFVSLIKWVPALDIDRSSHAVACGFVVTSLHLIAGVSGPLLDLFYLQSQKSRFETIATKAFTQSLGHFMKLVYFGSFASTLELSGAIVASLVGCALAGTLLGGMVLHRMSDHDFRKQSRRIVMVLGGVCLARAFYETWV